MASSPSTRTCSWKTTPDSPYRLCSFCSLPSSFLPHKNRTQFTHFSISNISSSPSSSSSCSTDNCRDSINTNLLRKPSSEYPIGKSSSTQISKLTDGNSFFAGNEEDEQGVRWRKVGRKLLFGKRPLWKRVFFASQKVKSIILLNVLTVICASDIPVIKEAEEVIDPALFTCVRFVVSAIPFLPFILRARGDGQTRAAGIELGFWVSLGYLSQALGLVTSDAGRASFISAFTVIVVPFIDGILGATVPFLTWFGAFMSLVGVAMLESSGSPPSVGDVLNIFSAVFFGIHMLRTEHIARITKKENFLPLLGYEVSVVALFSTLWYFFMGGFHDVHGLSSASWQWAMLWDGMASFPWIPALYTGVLSTGLCLWIEMAAMCDISATETAIIYGLEPVWGAAFAWFLLGERWSTAGWVGAVLVLGGSLTVQIWGSAPEKHGTDEENSRQIQVSGEQEKLLVSAVVVSSRKNVPDLLRK
ncbi:hypothetical protein AAC387_Pa01g1509 [Persea americana]